MRSSASAWATVRGNPSRTKPLAASGRASRSSTRPITTSSGTSAARVHVALGLEPERRVPAAPPRAACRRWRPGARPTRRRAARACVPLPAPGAPRKITRMLTRGLRLLAQEALVVPHEQMRLHLADGIQGHADHDEQAGAAEVERRVEPADEEVREHRDQGEEDRPRQRDPGERPVDVLRRLLAGPHAGDEPPVLLHVVGEVHRVEDDGGVEVREEDDEGAVHHRVGEVAGRQGLGDRLHPRVVDEPRQGRRETGSATRRR